MTAEPKLIAGAPAAEASPGAGPPQAAGVAAKGDFAAALVEVASTQGETPAAKPLTAMPPIAPPATARPQPMKAEAHAAAAVPITHKAAAGAAVPARKTTPDPVRVLTIAETVWSPPPPTLLPPSVVTAAAAAHPLTGDSPIAASASEQAVGNGRGISSPASASSPAPAPGLASTPATAAEPTPTRPTPARLAGSMAPLSPSAPAKPTEPGTQGNAAPLLSDPVATNSVSVGLPSTAGPHSALAVAGSAHATAPSMQVAQVLVQLSAADGTRRISLQLTPTDLGRVDILLDQPRDGPARITLTAEHPQTLVALQRDENGLSLALDRAGVAGEGRVVVYHLAAPLAADIPVPGPPTHSAPPPANAAAHGGLAQNQFAGAGSSAGGSNGGSADNTRRQTMARGFATADGLEDNPADGKWRPSDAALGALRGGLNITA